MNRQENARKKFIGRTVALFLVVAMLVSGIFPFGVFQTARAKAASKVSLSQKTANLYVGGTVTLKLKGTNKKAVWSTSAKNIAVVTQKGKVTAKKAGKAVITASVAGQSYQCKLTVKKPGLNYTIITMLVGDKTALKVVGIKKKAKWSSSNKKVAVVSKVGKVTAKKAGKTTIVAKVGKKKYKCKVTVSKVLPVQMEDKGIVESEYSKNVDQTAFQNLKEGKDYELDFSQEKNGILTVQKDAVTDEVKKVQVGEVLYLPDALDGEDVVIKVAEKIQGTDGSYTIAATQPKIEDVFDSISIDRAVPLEFGELTLTGERTDELTGEKMKVFAAGIRKNNSMQKEFDIPVDQLLDLSTDEEKEDISLSGEIHIHEPHVRINVQATDIIDKVKHNENPLDQMDVSITETVTASLKGKISGSPIDKFLVISPKLHLGAGFGINLILYCGLDLEGEVSMTASVTKTAGLSYSKSSNKISPIGTGQVKDDGFEMSVESQFDGKFYAHPVIRLSFLGVYDKEGGMIVGVSIIGIEGKAGFGATLNASVSTKEEGEVTIDIYPYFVFSIYEDEEQDDLGKWLNVILEKTLGKKELKILDNFSEEEKKEGYKNPFIKTITLIGNKKSDTTDTDSEESVTGDFTSISLGNGHAAALKKDGSLWIWGKNDMGQLGDGYTRESTAIPSKVLDDVKMVSLGDNYSAALKKDGSLWMWGKNISQAVDFDDERKTQSYFIEPVKVMDNIKKIMAQNTEIFVLKEDNTLWNWSYHGIRYYAPRQILEDVKDFDVGFSADYGNYSYAVIKKDGSLWMWGQNSYGQMGNGTTIAFEDEPKKIMDNISSVSIGFRCTAAVKKDGTLWTWGEGKDGKLGNGKTADLLKPKQVMEDVKTVYMSDNSYAGAIKKDGSLWMWGANGRGQLGNGTKENSTVPVKVLDNVKTISLGYDYSAAIKKDGTLWMWGYNDGLRLGPNVLYDSKSRSNQDILIPTLIDFQESSGASGTFGKDTEGERTLLQ